MAEPCTNTSVHKSQSASSPISSLQHASLNSATGDTVSLQKGLIAVIPAYNEQVSIGTVTLLARQYVDRVIVVSDGSTDRTAEVAKMAGAEVISLEHNTVNYPIIELPGA